MPNAILVFFPGLNHVEALSRLDLALPHVRKSLAGVGESRNLRRLQIARTRQRAAHPALRRAALTRRGRQRNSFCVGQGRLSCVRGCEHSRCPRRK